MNSKLKRRWFRFSLRSLLVFVTIACGGFGWLGSKVRRAQRQREAVSAIRDMGGVVTYDYEEPYYYLPTPAPAPGPAWLRNLFGIDFLANVGMVDFHYTDAPNAALEQVKKLPQLRYLDLSRTQVTDIGLVHLQGLTGLETLHLGRTQITDAGLIHLRGLTELIRLTFFDDTQVTDVAVQHLKKEMPNVWIQRYKISEDAELAKGDRSGQN